MTSENFRTNPMFLRNQFKVDGIFDIPLLQTDEIDLEEIELIGYYKLCDNKTEAIVHFFMDDYKFEAMWKDPEPRIERLKEYRAVLTPDFSMYTEMPLSIKVYNTFRSRWCGAYMQDKGIKVIPTVSWGEPNTFWFCFDGIPKGSVVAVSTIGVRKEKSLFMQGYEEMMRKIKPKAVICYGEPFEDMKGKIIKVDYAQTNNYKKHYTFYYEPGQEQKSNVFDMYIKRAYGCVAFEKGRGSAFRNTLPNAAKCEISESKINNYALNPNHETGKNKARVFQSASGFNKDNSKDLIRQIKESVSGHEAVRGVSDQYGQRYHADIPIKGPNGKVVTVRTAWIIDANSGIPKLISLYVKGE